jgi:hypothetical protein
MKNYVEQMKFETEGLGLIMYQENTKGQLVPKVGGCKDEREGVEYTMNHLIRAKGMQPKEGAKYLRVMQISRMQPISFLSFKSTRVQKLGKIRLGQFIDTYSLSTLIAILEGIKAEK